MPRPIVTALDECETGCVTCAAYSRCMDGAPRSVLADAEARERVVEQHVNRGAVGRLGRGRERDDAVAGEHERLVVIEDVLVLAPAERLAVDVEAPVAGRDLVALQAEARE